MGTAIHTPTTGDAPQSVPTMPTKEPQQLQQPQQPYDHIRVPPGLHSNEVNLHKQKMNHRHAVKKRQVDTSATAGTSGGGGRGAGAVQPSLPWHKPQPPTKPKSNVSRISTSSRPPPVSITVAPAPPQPIPIISPLSSPPPPSSPKKSPSQNVLPGEQRRLQLENRLQLIKREAAIRRNQQHKQRTKTTQAHEHQQPQPQSQHDADNGAEYFTRAQIPSNEAIQYYSEMQSDGDVGSQIAPPQDGDESVETITMSVC